MLKWRAGGGNKESIENLAGNLSGSAVALFQGISILGKAEVIRVRLRARQMYRSREHS
jgi:hypothetical protein